MLPSGFRALQTLGMKHACLQHEWACTKHLCTVPLPLAVPSLLLLLICSGTQAGQPNAHGACYDGRRNACTVDLLAPTQLTCQYDAPVMVDFIVTLLSHSIAATCQPLCYTENVSGSDGCPRLCLHHICPDHFIQAGQLLLMGVILPVHVV